MRLARLALILSMLVPCSAFAGGAWVPDPWHGFISLGYSRKTATSSWDANGVPFDNRVSQQGDPPDLRLKTGPLSVHDFNYLLLAGETGLFRHVSVTYLFTFLYGVEGPDGNQDIGIGFSDAWLGAKFQYNQLIHLPEWPLAVAFTARVPWFYAQPGPYTRYIDGCQQNPKSAAAAKCSFVGQSSSWLGVLKYDLAPSLLASKSLPRNLGWVNTELGFVVRTGAPADAVTFDVNFGLRIPIPKVDVYLKGDLYGYFSVTSPGVPQPDDRFGQAVGSVYNFNDASIVKGYLSLFVRPWKGLFAELGYGRWLWGESARQYNELYAGLGWVY